MQLCRFENNSMTILKEEILISCCITGHQYSQTSLFFMVCWLLLLLQHLFWIWLNVTQETAFYDPGEDLWSGCVLYSYMCTHYCLCYPLWYNILWFPAMQSHSRCHEPIISSRLLHHHILITSDTLVSLEQNQTATLQWTHTQTHTHACTQISHPQRP